MRPNPFQSLVNLLSNVLEAHTTAFFTVEPHKRLFNLAASQSLRRQLPENLSIPIEQSGILSQAHKGGQTIHFDKMHEMSMPSSSALPFYREGECDIKGLLIEPVGGGEGLLYVDTKYSWGFNTKQQKWIKEVAELLYDLMRQKGCLSWQRNLEQIWQLWRRLDYRSFKEGSLQDYCRLLVEECARFLAAEYGLLAIHEPAGHRYRLIGATANMPPNYLNQSFNSKQGLIGWIFRNQKPLFIPRLNADSSEHFLLNTRESLPHYGALWGLPAISPSGHSLVLAFLSRGPREWSEEDQDAVSHVLYQLHLLLEQSYLREECEHLRAYDFASGILNALTFEAKVEETLLSGIQSSTPCIVALLQLEPWQIMHTRMPPRQLRDWQQLIAEGLYHNLPTNVFLGQIAENRYGLLLPGMGPQEVNQHLNTALEVSRQVTPKRIKKAKLQPFMSVVQCPQEASTVEELWALAYQRLFEAFHSTNR